MSHNDFSCYACGGARPAWSVQSCFDGRQTWACRNHLSDVVVELQAGAVACEVLVASAAGRYSPDELDAMAAYAVESEDRLMAAAAIDEWDTTVEKAGEQQVENRAKARAKGTHGHDGCGNPECCGAQMPFSPTIGDLIAQGLL